MAEFCCTENRAATGTRRNNVVAYGRREEHRELGREEGREEKREKTCSPVFNVHDTSRLFSRSSSRCCSRTPG